MKSKRLKSIVRVSGIVLLVAAIVLGIVLLVTPQQKQLTPDGFSWERTIGIEKLQPVNECSWSLPAGARLQRTSQEIYSYEQVLDHYETRTRQVAKERLSGYEDYVTGYRDLGNGLFEETTGTRPVYETYYETETYQEPIYRSEPIYRTKYHYEIDRWLHERNISTSGVEREPVWGEVILVRNERESDRTECFYLLATDSDGKQDTYQTSREMWDSLEVGETILVKVYIGNWITENE
ncbi:MAG: hypothetical protein ACK5LX_13930 [Oscillospiraceae bacterium]